ncbi:MAG: ribosome silencing factor [Planctomycetota bacterium JB042]
MTEFDTKELALLCARACDERKGEDIRVLDVRDQLPIVDYFILATGRNRRHLRSMADEIRRLQRDRLGKEVPREEGSNDGGRWLLLDLGDVIVHLFDAETRSFYDIDGLWADAPRVAISA